MSEKNYKKMVSKFKSNKGIRVFLLFSNKILPLVFYITYPLLLTIKFISGIDKEFIRMLVVPICVFLGVTVMRKLINRPRPYEKFRTAPVIPNDRVGESFPSRHTASGIIIAISAIYLNIALAIVLLVLASVISICRILAGIHYISDVLFGAIFAVLFGIVFFLII